jgi:predicted DsbA family dithiol-disulfide isomerase
MLTHYNSDMAALLDWICPECKEGRLRYAPANARFEYELRKHKKADEAERTLGQPEAGEQATGT